VTSYGAIGDGVTVNTTQIQAAINAAATSPNQGGTVEIPAGTYLCGPLNLSNNINLQVDAGAMVMMLPMGQYPGGTSPAALLTANRLHDIEISGSGVLEGQGSAWWPGYKTNSRPIMANIATCNRVLIQDVTLQNSPMQFFSVKGKAGNVTLQRVKIFAPSSSDPVNPSHNTDAIDLAETNCIIRDCIFSEGDDNVAMGSSASASVDILITNCTFGTGHGVSIGSFTSGGVSNITVVNCSFTETDNGIRIKSDNDRGGVVQNVSYLNLKMTNVDVPITIYGYYNEFGTITGITPQIAAAQGSDAITTTMPTYRNLLISNVTATVPNGGIAGLIWGRTEFPITNVTISGVTIQAPKSFRVYNATGIQLANCQMLVPGGRTNLDLFNAGVVLSNTVATIGGLTSTNSIALYNTSGRMNAGDLLGATPFTLGNSIFSNGTSLTLSPSSVLNFGLGAVSSAAYVNGNLALNGTINISDLSGFGAGTYTLFNCVGYSVSGTAQLGSQPRGFICALDTSTPGFLNLNVFPKVNAWGYDGSGETDVSPVLTNATGVAAGAYHTLALISDGTVSAWGDDSVGQCDVPAGLSNVVSIAAGAYHNLALRTDGSLVAWGDDSAGQCDPPSGATNIVAVSAGDWHSLALRADGKVFAWGDNSWGQSQVPSIATNVIAISAGGEHSLALNADGTVLGWGSSIGPSGAYAGQRDVPSGLARVVAISAGGFHSLALQDDGTIVAWGDNSRGQCTVPPALKALVISAGSSQSLAIVPGGTVVAWGDNYDGQCSVPSGLDSVTDISAGGSHCAALSGSSLPGLLLANTSHLGKAFAVNLQTQRAHYYFLQYKNLFKDTNWTLLKGMAGDGGVKPITDQSASLPQRFYRVRRQ
jgi:polygalacturonase